MKLSIPTINIERNTDSKQSEVTLLSVGFGLHLGWMYTSMYGSESVFSIEGDTVMHSYTWLFIVSIITFGLCCIIFGFMDKRFRDLFLNKRGLIFSTSIMFFGTALATACGFLDGPTLRICSIVAGLITGIGSAMVFLSWGAEMSKLDYQSLVINLSISLVIAFIVYALALQILPTPFSGICASLLPVFEALILWYKRHSLFKDDQSILANPLPVNKWGFSVRYCIPIAFLGIAFGLLKASALLDMLQTPNQNAQLIIIIGAAIAFVFTTFVLSSAKRDSDDPIPFKFILPIVAIASLLIPFQEKSIFPGIIETVLIFAFFCIEILLLSSYSNMSQSYRLSAVYVFGIGRGVQAFAALTGSVITMHSEAIVQFLPWGDPGGCVLILVCLIICLCTLPTRAVIEHYALNTCSLTFYYRRDGVSLNNLNAIGLDTINAAQKPDQTPAPIMAATAAAAIDSPRQATGTIDDPIPQQELLQAQCEAIANCYLLSQRETEVFYYLAKGYNSARIQEVLYISEGTAKTHIRHIYRKLSIHSQQDLIRMVDETLG